MNTKRGAAAVLLAALLALVTPLDGRDRVVAAAVGDLGKSDPAPYELAELGQVPSRPLAWCGLFALHAIHVGRGCRAVHWKIGYGFLYRLPITTSPRPGDVAYFDRFEHHALVERVRGELVDLVQGNGAGGKVTRSTTSRRAPHAYYSIDPCFRAPLNQEPSL